jgi:prolyl-tRNA synthetase
VVVDAQVPLTSNMVCGANEEGYHLINVNFGRDFTAQKIAEISVPRQGDSCPNCGFPMEMIDSIRLADISVPDLQHTILDARSNQVALHGLICSISLNRLLACMVEENHDEYGIIWPPVSSAPFAVHLILIGEQDSMAGKAADEIYQRLRILGLEALYDERPERAGVKFMDADLIGIPLRITVSQRTLSQNAVEFKQRSAKESRLVGIAVIDSEVENIYKQHNQDHKDMIP